MKGQNVERLRLKPLQIWEDEEEEEGRSQAVAHTGSLQHHRRFPLPEQPLKQLLVS